MKLELIIDTNGVVHGAHGESDHNTRLDPCPFCGSEDVEVSNSHTPSYQGGCNDCGAKGPSSGPYPKRIAKTKRGATLQHENAFFDAVNRWNSRTKTP